MPVSYTSDYLLDKKIKIFQPTDGYRASTDAVLLAAMPNGLEKGAKILDVGSGTGAISLCMAHHWQKSEVSILGLELQDELVELSNLSAQQNDYDFVHFQRCDIRSKENIPHPCSFDVVITNPPYSDHDMPSPNKSKATAHNHSDFNLTLWLNFCLKMLKPFGKIYVVNRTEALPEICNVFYGKAGNITVLPIYSKKGQQAKRVIICAQKDSKSPCKILPPFVTHNEEGYTTKAENILRKGHLFSV